METARLVLCEHLDYTNDPTAIGAIYKWNDSYILDEEVYQTGFLDMNNRARARVVKKAMVEHAVYQRKQAREAKRDRLLDR